MTLPRTLFDIPTPALTVDIAVLERNIQRMAQYFAERPCKLRPHFKAHKTPEIARRQLAGGSCTGLTCATVKEAEIAASFCQDLLIANEIVGPAKCQRVAALARNVQITVSVDSALGLDEIGSAAREAGVRVGILVDLDVGMARCGVAPGEAALALARRAVQTEGVTLRGLMGYEGHAVGVIERPERERRARESMQRLLATSELLRKDGLPCEIVSAGGTGTYDISSRFDGITEIQAGSYALMDTAYAKLDLPFERALSVVGTVISRPAPTRCVADCGHKSATQDHGNPSVKGLDAASVLSLSDEHATIALPADCPIKIGDRIQLWPSHIDPTINLHDTIYALEGETVVDLWPIAARGYE